MAPVIVLAVLASTSTLSAERFIANAIAGRGALPSLEDVQRAAIDALGVVDDADARAWPSRARWRGLVPRFDAEVGSNEGLDVRDTAYGASGAITTAGYKLLVDLRARWELGELVFNDMELRANRETLARAAAIHLALERVTKLYFERLEILLKQRDDTSPALALSAARLDGLIRAATAGRLDRDRKEHKP
jgi:hypothetical protein